MNKLAMILVLAVAAGAALGGAYADPDPQMFLDKAKMVQEKVRPQADASDETRALFAEGEQMVAKLEQAIADGDAEAAKESFKAAMMAFKEIAGEEWKGYKHDGDDGYEWKGHMYRDGGEGRDGAWDKAGHAQKDPSKLLEKMQGFAAMARENNPEADFAAIDGLLDKASEQIAAGQDDAALETLREAAGMIKAHGGKYDGAGHRDMDGHDPQMFLDKAKMVQEKVRPQADASDETRALFAEGEQMVAKLEQAIADGDAEAAKESFKAAMMAFKKIAGEEWVGHHDDDDDNDDWERDAADLDPGIFLKIAERLQERIRPQVADAPEDARAQFAEGEQMVAKLEQAIADGDAEAAKESFMAAMKAFRGAVGEEWVGHHDDDKGPINPSTLVERMRAYTDSLRDAAERHGMDADFTTIDGLLDKASEQIAAGQDDAARETLHEAKEMIMAVRAELGGKASEHDSKRSLEYAAKYIERLGGMIDEAAEGGAPAGEVEKLRADLDAARKTLEMIQGGDGDLIGELAKQLRQIKAALAS